MRVIPQGKHYPFRIDRSRLRHKPDSGRRIRRREVAGRFNYFPPRLALNRATTIPITNAIAPAAAHNGDPPTIGSQFATQSIGRIWIMAIPWRNQSRPRDAIKAPISTPTICMSLIPDLATRAYVILKLRTSWSSNAGEQMMPRSS